jgi:hypothetical protein
MRACCMWVAMGALASLVSMFTPIHAKSQPFCAQPDPPSCHRYLMQSSQSWEFDDCRAKIIRFQSEIRELFNCHEQTRIRQEQIRRQLADELEEAIRRFNNCARDRLC